MTLKVNINIIWIKKNAQYNVKNVPAFVPVFLYADNMLIFQINRIISSDKWFNYEATFFFVENARSLGRSDDAKRRKKKRMALSKLAQFSDTFCIHITFEKYRRSWEAIYSRTIVLRWLIRPDFIIVNVSLKRNEVIITSFLFIDTFTFNMILKVNNAFYWIKKKHFKVSFSV